MIQTERLKTFDRDWMYVRDCTVPLYSVKGAHVDLDVFHEFIDWTMVWCVKKFGWLENLDTPEITWCMDSDTMRRAGFLAYYDSEDNEITLRITGHRNFYNLAETIIHEYIHYLQPKSGGWYDRYYKTYKYEDHPYEVEAYYLSEVYAVDAYNWVVSKMNTTLIDKGITND